MYFSIILSLLILIRIFVVKNILFKAKSFPMLTDNVCCCRGKYPRNQANRRLLCDFTLVRATRWRLIAQGVGWQSLCHVDCRDPDGVEIWLIVKLGATRPHTQRQLLFAGCVSRCSLVPSWAQAKRTSWSADPDWSVQKYFLLEFPWFKY